MESISSDAVLALGKDLWESRDSLTLDHVDGAFYWHLCRPELKQALLKLLDESNHIGDPEWWEFHNRVEDLRAQGVKGDDLRQAIAELDWVKQHQTVFDHLYKMEQEIPDFNRQMTRSPRMRAPVFTWYAGRPPSIPCFQMGWVNQGSGLWFF